MEIIFLALSLLLIISAVGVLAFRNPIYSCFSLITHMLGIAALFASLEAHFLAAVQIIVYAGAIMVLVLFVLMLLNVKVEKPSSLQTIATICCLIVGAIFLYLLVPHLNEVFAGFRDHREVDGSLSNIGNILYTKFVFLFEAAAVLLTAALVGSVMLAKRNPSKELE
ncbi:MAG: NADH-quinone oxidoreductase subunit J [Bdellovibrionota bacterium]